MSTSTHARILRRTATALAAAAAAATLAPTPATAGGTWSADCNAVRVAHAPSFTVDVLVYVDGTLQASSIIGRHAGEAETLDVALTYDRPLDGEHEIVVIERIALDDYEGTAGHEIVRTRVSCGAADTTTTTAAPTSSSTTTTTATTSTIATPSTAVSDTTSTSIAVGTAPSTPTTILERPIPPIPPSVAPTVAVTQRRPCPADNPTAPGCTLPATGSGSAPLVAAAVAFLALGIIALGTTRRRAGSTWS